MNSKHVDQLGTGCIFQSTWSAEGFFVIIVIDKRKTYIEQCLSSSLSHFVAFSRELNDDGHWRCTAKEKQKTTNNYCVTVVVVSLCQLASSNFLHTTVFFFKTKSSSESWLFSEFSADPNRFARSLSSWRWRVTTIQHVMLPWQRRVSGNRHRNVASFSEQQWRKKTEKKSELGPDRQTTRLRKSIKQLLL